ncbi:MAG: thiamine biosynthesis protein ThiF, partial [Mesorhizobium sp.]
QVIHGTDTIGMAKTDSASAAIMRINPNVRVELHRLRLTAENAPALVAGYDVVVDGSDNFETRYALADACAEEQKPLVTAAVGRFDGSVTVLKPFETGADGKRNPGYRDL